MAVETEKRALVEKRGLIYVGDKSAGGEWRD